MKSCKTSLFSLDFLCPPAEIFIKIAVGDSAVLQGFFKNVFVRFFHLYTHLLIFENYSHAGIYTQAFMYDYTVIINNCQ